MKNIKCVGLHVLQNMNHILDSVVKSIAVAVNILISQKMDWTQKCIILVKKIKPLIIDSKGNMESA